MTRIERATRETFSSLRTRNFRLYLGGQLVSVTGTWMQWVAQGWLVLRLTESGVALGTVVALQFLPSFAGGMWGGVLADRYDKRRILMATQLLMGILGIALGVLTATGAIRLWMVNLLALLFGIVTVADTPARQAFVTEMVGPAEVPNAVALNGAVFNAGRIVGPAVAALLIATAGLAWAFILNGVSYFAVILALKAMNTDALHREGLVDRGRAKVREGLIFAWRTPELRHAMVIIAIVGTMSFNFTVILPLLAKRTFHGGAGTYGMLTSVMAAGSVVGALYTAKRARPTARLLVSSTVAFSGCLLLASGAPSLNIEAAILVFAGAAGIIMFATANATVQMRTPPFLRGRVMALYALIFLGGTAIGGPIAGWIAELAGPRAALAVGGVSGLLGAYAGWFSARESQRRATLAADEVADLPLVSAPVAATSPTK